MTSEYNSSTTANDTAGYPHQFYRRYGKRALDIFLSLTALIIFSPILLILCLLVRFFHGSPILFSPTRPGLHERIFPIYKFRTMSNAKNSEGKLLPEKDRLTVFGRFLRASSLDELPELLNILFGDMSIVGPRPLAKGYLEYYTEEQRMRHSVLPGLTGLAQVSGRNNLIWDRRVAKDIEYVKNVSFSLDVKIIVDTFLKVISHKDVAVPGNIIDLAAYNLIREEGAIHCMSEKTTWPETGSHFWLEEEDQNPENNKNWFSGAEDGTFTFSGRAAIALALRDAMKTRKITNACVPSYCCLSMLQPFIDLDIPYEFYDVKSEGGKIIYDVDFSKKCDVFLIMKYFGADADNYDAIISKLSEKGSIVIEDITHTLLDENCENREADYHVASLRKWFPVPTGGMLKKTKGKLQVRPDAESNHAVRNKLKAMQEKYNYLKGKNPDKEAYLQKFSTFEQDLIQLNVLLKIDDTSKHILETTDIENVKRKRRVNASVLYDRLKELPGLQFLNPDYDLGKKVPLFVPVMLPAEIRSELRIYLIEKGIYCPVHWPEVVGARPGIRRNELSLICDQRYSAKDMHYVADLIIDWFRDRSQV